MLAESGGGGRTGKDAERGGPLPHPQIFFKNFSCCPKTTLADDRWNVCGGLEVSGRTMASTVFSSFEEVAPCLSNLVSLCRLPSTCVAPFVAY